MNTSWDIVRHLLCLFVIYGCYLVYFNYLVALFVNFHTVPHLFYKLYIFMMRFHQAYLYKWVTYGRDRPLSSQLRRWKMIPLQRWDCNKFPPLKWLRCRMGLLFLPRNKRLMGTYELGLSVAYPSSLSFALLVYPVTRRPIRYDPVTTGEQVANLSWETSLNIHQGKIVKL